MSDFSLKPTGFAIDPEPGNPNEVEGVLNPAAARGQDGELYLFPRLVGKANYSRIGIFRVRFDDAGEPSGVERLGIALEPEADYEKRPGGGGGCEDPRVTYVEELQRYVMTYTAFSPNGPRIAIATSLDLLTWERHGLANFDPPRGIALNDVDNKDAAFFPTLVERPGGPPGLAMLHRPLFPGTLPEDTMCMPADRDMDQNKESIWMSISAMDPASSDLSELTHFRTHHRLAYPMFPWESLKIGTGAPPMLTPHGWLLIYHGVEAIQQPDETQRLTYSAGAMVLAPLDPLIVEYRSDEPVLVPPADRRRGDTFADVVFPTGLDRRDDLGQPDRVDVYYGVNDFRIEVATLTVPKVLPATPEPS